MKSLEDQLRFKIFERGGNAVSLTPEGETYVARVREALERIVAASMEATGQSQAHVLRICVLPTFAARWLFPRMASFQRQYPDIEMRVSTSYATHEFWNLFGSKKDQNDDRQDDNVRWLEQVHMTIITPWRGV